MGISDSDSDDDLLPEDPLKEDRDEHLRPSVAEEESSTKRVRTENGPKDCARPPPADERSDEEKRAAAFTDEEAAVDEHIEQLFQQWVKDH